MNAMIVLVIAIAVLVVGYIFYGGWLARQWGVKADRVTPAHEFEDGVDYVPAKPYVVLGHHFSSIAGAGPINGPIQAAVFGWVPVLLWVLIGGIFIGAVHDFGSLFASLRHKGQTIAVVIAENIDATAKRLFCIFAYLTLVLVVAAFASIVANTFAVSAAASDAVNLANQRTAMISVLFIFAAVIYGLFTRGRNLPPAASIVLAIGIVVLVIAVGYNLPVISLDYTAWMLIIGVYILIASVAPVWILLQPRDYLSSYLLYGMMALAVIGIVGAGVMGAASNMDIPAFTGFFASNAAVTPRATPSWTRAPARLSSTRRRPRLFVPRAVHHHRMRRYFRLPQSGGVRHHVQAARPRERGAAHRLRRHAAGVLAGRHLAVRRGVCVAGLPKRRLRLSHGCVRHGPVPDARRHPGLENVESIAYALLILAVSAFCLTSLDTATRLARYMFQELWLSGDETLDTATGAKKALANPYVATIITVVVGIALGMTGYTLIWPLFGAANQLLAALALLAVCAWLGNAGRNNKMFYVPMVFMLAVTLTSLCMTIQSNAASLAGGGDALAAVVQMAIAVLLLVLAVILAVKGAKTVMSSAGKKTSA